MLGAWHGLELARLILLSQINDLILACGHYYVHSHSTAEFEELFVYMRDVKKAYIILASATLWCTILSTAQMYSVCDIVTVICTTSLLLYLVAW